MTAADWWGMTFVALVFLFIILPAAVYSCAKWATRGVIEQLREMNVGFGCTFPDDDSE